MTIHYQCNCGNAIQLPDKLAGRLATCRKCSTIFTVPPPATNTSSSDENGDRQSSPSDEQDDGLLDLLSLPSANPPPLPPMPPGIKSDDETDDHEEIEEEESPGSSSFWGDLIEAFEFIVHGRSLVTFILLTLLFFLGSFMSCVPILGLIVMFLLNGYLCAYCLSVIIQSAMGEDELPELSFDNFWDDVIGPFLRVIISWICVLIPAFAMAIGYYAAHLPMDWELFGILVIAGACFWPVTILMVAIADGFGGLSPLLVFRTILSAPIPYVVVIASLVFAGGITTYVETQLAPAAWTPTSWAAMLSTFFLGKMINIYSMIVSMRIIGLYYRHYQSRFPWTA